MSYNQKYKMKCWEILNATIGGKVVQRTTSLEHPTYESKTYNK